MAEVFVLLLGEIDLSIGYNRASARCSRAGCWLPPTPVPWWLAVLVGLAVPALFSGAPGRDHHPAPAAVLRGHAGRAAGAGALLLVVMQSAAPQSAAAASRLYSTVLSDIEGGALSPLASWIVMAVAVVLAGAIFSCATAAGGRAISPRLR